MRKIFNLHVVRLAICMGASLLGVNAYGQATTCTLNGSGQITDTAECYTQPDEQYVTFYKVALCRSSPVAPTSTSPIGTNSCVTVFESATGSQVLIQKSISTVPAGGTYTKPPVGNYTYGYVEVSPAMSIKKVARFNRTVTSADGTSGTTCWSKTGVMYSVQNVVNAPASCGATASGVGIATQNISSLNGSAGFVSTRTFPASQGGNITAHLIDSSRKLGTGVMNGLGTVDKVVGYIPLSVTITPRTSVLSIAFNNSMGTNVGFYNSGANIFNFSGGPFDFTFNVEEK